jgi:hypothetical protein
MSNSEVTLWTGECKWNKSRHNSVNVNVVIVCTHLPQTYKNLSLYFSGQICEIRLFTKPNLQKYDDFKTKYFGSGNIEESIRIELRSSHDDIYDDINMSSLVQHLKTNDKVGLLSIKGSRSMLCWPVDYVAGRLCGLVQVKGQAEDHSRLLNDLLEMESNYTVNLDIPPPTPVASPPVAMDSQEAFIIAPATPYVAPSSPEPEPLEQPPPSITVHHQMGPPMLPRSSQIENNQKRYRCPPPGVYHPSAATITSHQCISHPQSVLNQHNQVFNGMRHSMTQQTTMQNRPLPHQQQPSQGPMHQQSVSYPALVYQQHQQPPHYGLTSIIDPSQQEASHNTNEQKAEFGKMCKGLRQRIIQLVNDFPVLKLRPQQHPDTVQPHNMTMCKSMESLQSLYDDWNNAQHLTETFKAIDLLANSVSNSINKVQTLLSQQMLQTSIQSDQQSKTQAVTGTSPIQQGVQQPISQTQIKHPLLMGHQTTTWRHPHPTGWLPPPINKTPMNQAHLQLSPNSQSPNCPANYTVRCQSTAILTIQSPPMISLPEFANQAGPSRQVQQCGRTSSDRPLVPIDPPVMTSRSSPVSSASLSQMTVKDRLMSGSQPIAKKPPVSSSVSTPPVASTSKAQPEPILEQILKTTIAAPILPSATIAERTKFLKSSVFIDEKTKTQSSSGITNLLQNLRSRRSKSQVSSTPPTPTASPSPLPSPKSGGEHPAVPDFRRLADSPEFLGTHQGTQVPVTAPSVVIKKEPEPELACSLGLRTYIYKQHGTLTFQCDILTGGQNRSNVVVVVYLPAQDRRHEHCFLLIIPESVEEARLTNFSEMHHIECEIDSQISTFNIPTKKVILLLKSISIISINKTFFSGQSQISCQKCDKY